MSEKGRQLISTLEFFPLPLEIAFTFDKFFVLMPLCLFAFRRLLFLPFSPSVPNTMWLCQNRTCAFPELPQVDLPSGICPIRFINSFSSRLLELSNTRGRWKKIAPTAKKKSFFVAVGAIFFHRPLVILKVPKFRSYDSCSLHLQTTYTFLCSLYQNMLRRFLQSRVHNLPFKK